MKTTPAQYEALLNDIASVLESFKKDSKISKRRAWQIDSMVARIDYAVEPRPERFDRMVRTTKLHVSTPSGVLCGICFHAWDHRTELAECSLVSADRSCYNCVPFNCACHKEPR